MRAARLAPMACPKGPVPARRRALPLGLVGGLAALLVGCAAPPPPPPPVTDRVVLLPQTDGRPSAVELQAGGQTLRLAQPYATADLAGGTLRPGTTTAEAVQQRYGRLLAQLPARPQTITLQFESNGTRLTRESEARLPEVQRVLAGLPAPEVVVTGHTDRVGSVEANDRLSLRRAEAVRDILVAAGVPRQVIGVAGRGEREPLVPTDDEVAEPRNRRVEIKLR